MKIVIDRLCELRKDNDLNQQLIAKVLGVAQQQYSQYETGMVELPLRHFIKLAEYYHVSADYLIGRKSAYAVKPLGTMYVTCDCTCEKLIDDIFSLDEESRKSVVEYVELQKLKQMNKNP